MKINDLEVTEAKYNITHEISDIIARLNYPQKYIILTKDDEYYNLKIKSVDEKKFIVEIDGLVENGRK